MLAFTILILIAVVWTIRNIYVMRKERKERRQDGNSDFFISWV